MPKRNGFHLRALAWAMLLASPLPAAAQSADPAIDALDRDPAVQRSFARDLRRGLIAAQLAPEDINKLLLPLTQAHLIAPVETRPRDTAHTQSLAEISNQVRRMIELQAELRTNYQVLEPRPRYLLIIPDYTPPPFPPAMSSWLNLRSMVGIALMFRLVARQRFTELRPEPEPLRWDRPARRRDRQPGI